MKKFIALMYISIKELSRDKDDFTLYIRVLGVVIALLFFNGFSASILLGVNKPGRGSSQHYGPKEYLIIFGICILFMGVLNWIYPEKKIKQEASKFTTSPKRISIYGCITFIMTFILFSILVFKYK